MTSVDKVRLKILEEIYKNIPPEAGLTKIEFEGPEIAIYLKDVKSVLEKEELIKSIAKIIKKRVVVRVDESSRVDVDKALEKILDAVPPDLGLTKEDVTFDEVLGEVVIKTTNPTVFFKDKRQLYNKIFMKTGWRPRILRKPPLRSLILESTMKYLISQSDIRRRIFRSVGERIHRDTLFKDPYIRLTALGGFQEVGRSSILLETQESKILLDFGYNPSAPTLKQSMPRLDAINVPLEDIDAVIVTHAHLDHCGLVPLLFKFGYEGAVYATEATRDLMTLLQLDLLDISRREGKPLPFDLQDVHKALLHTITLKYGEVTDIAPDVRLTFYRAGHILGSAIAHLHIGVGLHNVVYTSDFKYGKTRLLDEAHTEFPRVDTLLMESTYGNATQLPREEAEAKFIDVINRTLQRKGKVLIPTLAVGRAQEVLAVLAAAMDEGKIPEAPVYVEGMINEVTAIHTAYPDLLSSDIRNLINEGRNPFLHKNFKVVETGKARVEIVDSDEPAIILATSGMLTGGPAVEYFKIMASDPKNTILFVNYQAEGTLGRKVKDGVKNVNLVTENKIETITINMEVEAIEGFSGHSDQNQLLTYLENLTPKPKKIILNHGEPEATNKLYSLIEERKKKNRSFLPATTEVYKPRVLDSLALVV
ncbi:MAG: beta-CASP ribonuclease aCPSF1 [Desulfurococcaceae archaeon TW002]